MLSDAPTGRGRPPRPESKTEETPRGAASLAELLTSDKLKRLALPYPGYLAAWRLVKGHGKCIQGVNGRSTHRGTLCYSFDFKLAVGTPVLAARGGTIAAVVDHFRGGGAKAHLAPGDLWPCGIQTGPTRDITTSRRRDLYIKSAKIGRGQQIAWSSNTGYAGGPRYISISWYAGGNVYVAHSLPKHEAVAVRGSTRVNCPPPLGARSSMS